MQDVSLFSFLNHVTKLSLPNPVTNSVDSRDDRPAVEDEAQLRSSSDNWLHSPKKKPSLSQRLIWVTLVASLALHGLLMLLPTSSEKKPAAAKPEEKSVRITQLPTLIKAPKVQRLRKPVVAKKPIVVQKSTPARAPIPSVQPAKPKAAATDPGASTSNPWQDFPQYPGAEVGCFNLPSCFQSNDQLDQVSAFFEKELAAKKYTVKPTKTESGRKVYQVSKGNLTQFLNVLVNPGKGTVYVLAPNELTLEELSKAKAVPPEITAVFEGLDAQDATRDSFAQPDSFYSADTLRPDIIDVRLIPNPDASITADTFFDAYLSTNLRNSSFDDYPDTGQKYGGGPVYLAKKGKLTLYINTVPTKDGSGTIVVIWKKQPN